MSELTIDELQRTARKGTVSDFKYLLQEWGNVSVDGDAEGRTGRDYLKEAIESENAGVSRRAEKLKAVREYDTANNQSSAEDIQDTTENNSKAAREAAEDLQKSTKAVLAAVSDLKEEFTRAVAGFEEKVAGLEAKLSERDETVAGLTAQIEDLTAKLADLTSKQELTNTFAVKAAQGVVKLEGQMKALGEEVNTIKHPSLYKTAAPKNTP